MLNTPIPDLNAIFLHNFIFMRFTKLEIQKILRTKKLF